MQKSLSGFSLLVFVASCASADSGGSTLTAEAAEALSKYERTGETRSCMSTTQISAINPLDAHHFLVRVGVSKYYLNETSGCRGAGRAFNRIQYEVSGGQLCRNQIVQVVDNSSGFIVGSCGLGEFEELIAIDPADETATDKGSEG